MELAVADRQEAPTETSPPAVWELGSGAEPATVLYIEDNPVEPESGAALLGRLPHIRLLTATSGHAGLELAQRQMPDLLLLDLGLADISGAEVLKRLRAEVLRLLACHEVSEPR